MSERRRQGGREGETDARLLRRSSLYALIHSFRPARCLEQCQVRSAARKRQPFSKGVAEERLRSCRTAPRAPGAPQPEAPRSCPAPAAPTGLRLRLRSAPRDGRDPAPPPAFCECGLSLRRLQVSCEVWAVRAVRAGCGERGLQEAGGGRAGTGSRAC